MNTKYILLVLALIISTNSCKNFLDEEPIASISTEFLYTTPEGIKAGVVGLYNLNRDIYSIGPSENATSLYLHILNELVVGRAGFIYVIGKFDRDFISPDGYGSIFLKNIWRHHYKIIDRANAIIAAAEKLESLSDEDRNQAIAESKCLRAHSLFVLWRMFNNVYIKTEPTTPENVFDKIEGPNTKEEIFTQLHSDLDYAISQLEWTAETGRMTQAIARHIKAKAAMWQDNFIMAVTQTDSIINSGYYHLLDDPNDVFQGDRNHEEALWTIQIQDDISGGGPQNLIPANFQTPYHKTPGCVLDNEQGGRGFGFFYPNEYLIGLYDQNDARLEAYYNLKYYYNDPDNLPDGVELGDEVIIPNSGVDQAKYYERAHPSCQKYFDDDLTPPDVLSHKSILFFRLAETYLIAAEANMRAGNSGQALTYLKAITDRANVEPNFIVDQNVILAESARELAMEGHRWYLLKRTGSLVDRVQSFAGDEGYHDAARANIQEYMNNFPIPTVELQLLGQNYPQNEGY